MRRRGELVSRFSDSFSLSRAREEFEEESVEGNQGGLGVWGRVLGGVRRLLGG